MTANRIVCLVVSGVALAAGLSVALADMDTTSTAGVVAGVGSMTAIAWRWLGGWQAYEARQERIARDAIARAGRERLAGASERPE